MKNICLFTMFLIMVTTLGCSAGPTIYPPQELETTSIPTPSSFSDALNYIQSDMAEQRMIGMWAVLNYPDQAIEAIPLILINIHDSNSDVRKIAVKVLGEIGPAANVTVNDLIRVMQQDDNINVRIECAIALGSIGDESAVPFLAENLYQDDIELSIFSAKSISIITGVYFPDADKDSGFRSNEEGIPLIVIDAQSWWEAVGIHQDW